MNDFIEEYLGLVKNIENIQLKYELKNKLKNRKRAKESINLSLDIITLFSISLLIDFFVAFYFDINLFNIFQLSFELLEKIGFSSDYFYYFGVNILLIFIGYVYLDKKDKKTNSFSLYFKELEFHEIEIIFKTFFIMVVFKVINILFLGFFLFFIALIFINVYKKINIERSIGHKKAISRIDLDKLTKHKEFLINKISLDKESLKRLSELTKKDKNYELLNALADTVMKLRMQNLNRNQLLKQLSGIETTELNMIND